MKSLLAASYIAAVLLGSPAMAADLPFYKAPALPVVVPSWTGFYVGGNVGYSWGDARTDFAASGSITTSHPVFPGVFTSDFGMVDSNKAGLSGIVGGGQIGYNYQFSPRWLVGVEADIQGSGERGSSAFVDQFSTPLCVAQNAGGNCVFYAPLNGTVVTTYDAKIGWFGTVRGRVGFLLTDQTLLYGTGGLAYGGVKLAGQTSLSGAYVIPNTVTEPFFPTGTTFNSSATNLGFAVGGGIEGKFSSWLPARWTWKVEYLYLNLGSLDAATSYSTTFRTLAATPITGPVTAHARYTDNIVRVGLNYGF